MIEVSGLSKSYGKVHDHGSGFRIARGHMPELFRQLGLAPADARIVVVKSPHLFREFYANIAGTIILVDAPGVRSSNLPTIADRYASPPRPLYPLDPDLDFSPQHRGSRNPCWPRLRLLRGAGGHR